MGKLILIKHSMPILKEGIPSSQWKLSDEGIQKSEYLADFLKDFKFSKIYCSHEPKAVHTAEIAARILGKEVEPTSNLHEHVREQNRKIYGRTEFEEIIQNFFEQPDTLVYGEETANQAKERYVAAVEQIVGQTSRGEDIVIVSHGTVMTLFMKEKNPSVKSFEVWKSLGLPSIAVLDIKKYELDEIISV